MLKVVTFSSESKKMSNIKINRRLIIVGNVFFVISILYIEFKAQNFAHDELLLTDLNYRSGTNDPYALDRCVLDLNLPKNKDFATLIWFHVGGLNDGNKYIPEGLKKEIAVAAVNYRLYPKVKSPCLLMMRLQRLLRLFKI